MMVYAYILKEMNNVVIYIMMKLFINNQIIKNVLIVKIKIKLYKLKIIKKYVLHYHLINNKIYLLVF